MRYPVACRLDTVAGFGPFLLIHLYLCSFHDLRSLIISIHWYRCDCNVCLWINVFYEHKNHSIIMYTTHTNPDDRIKKRDIKYRCWMYIVHWTLFTFYCLIGGFFAYKMEEFQCKWIVFFLVWFIHSFVLKWCVDTHIHWKGGEE